MGGDLVIGDTDDRGKHVYVKSVGEEGGVLGLNEYEPRFEVSGGQPLAVVQQLCGLGRGVRAIFMMGDV